MPERKIQSPAAFLQATQCRGKVRRFLAKQQNELVTNRIVESKRGHGDRQRADTATVCVEDRGRSSKYLVVVLQPAGNAQLADHLEFRLAEVARQVRPIGRGNQRPGAMRSLSKSPV